MRADINIKEIELNAGARILMEIIDAWDYMSFKEQLETVQLPREIKKRWSEEYQKKKEANNNEPSR